MLIKDSGVVEPSFMDFSIPSSFCKNSLYFIPEFGHFYCDKRYHIRRDFLDLFLFVYVCSGSLVCGMNGKEFTVSADQAALLDCRVPHEYYCTEDTEFLWFHFNGSNSPEYTAYLFEQNGPLFTGTHVMGLRHSFESIFRYLQQIPSNEHLASMHVGRILSRLAAPEEAFSVNELVDPAIRFIRDNYDQQISLDDLAEVCSMSTSHFIRCFNRFVKRTPHEYLLGYRLRQAKHKLQSTDETVEQIAEECGFNSASHFARAFRKSNGLSPKEFRSIAF